MQKFKVKENDAGQRLDKFLTKSFPDMPQGILYKGIRKKRIKVNGKRTENAYKLIEGDLIELYINDEFLTLSNEKPEIFDADTDINIVYEDENLILIDKAPGLSVHADDTDKSNSLVTKVQAYLYKKGEYDPESEISFSPALCNRIDKNTGGIVIAAKNAKTLRDINLAIKEKRVQKKYLCIAHGIFDEKEALLTAYHKKDSKQNKVFIYGTEKEGTKQIQTKYRVLKEKDNLSLLEVELLTGRTHQIRAHLAHVGHPLAGDIKYGSREKNKDLPYKYQALYSYKLSFHFDESSHLSYLNGKEFSVKSVWFSKDF